MVRIPFGVAVGFSILLSCALSPAAERSWSEAKSSHFIVRSDGDEQSARAIVWRFEQLRAAIRSLWAPAPEAMNKPVLVLAVRGESGLRSLAPQFWEGHGDVRPVSIFVSGTDRYYIALRSDLKVSSQGEINPYFSADWSYAAAVINAGMKRELPLWFMRGFASLLSNIIIRETNVEVGRVVPWHLQRLQSGMRLPLGDLLTIDRSSPSYKDAERLALFDAESWALVNFLLFDDKGRHRPELERFINLLLDGRSDSTAFELAFGNINSLQQAFFGYWTRSVFEFGRLNIDMKVKLEDFGVRTLTSAETVSSLAAFHAAMKRPNEARSLIEQARKADPRDAASYEVEGLVWDAERKDAEARAAYGLAIERGSTHFYVHYRWSALSYRANPDAETLARIQQSLERATALNGNYAPALALLGDLKLRASQNDEALKLITRAITLEAGDAYSRLTLARVLWSLGRRDEAQRQARDALEIANSDEARAAVQRLIAFFASESSKNETH